MTQKIARMLALGAATLTLGFSSAQAQEEFELAMVIKSTNNPYYNATLSGALMAAENRGTAQNYGPTLSNAQAQIDIINNLAERRIPRSRLHRATRMRSCRP